MTSNPVRRADLEINPVSDGYVVYDPNHDRVHHLNATAALVLEHCSGRKTAADIAAILQGAYRLTEPIDVLVEQCLDQLRREGLVSAS